MTAAQREILADALDDDFGLWELASFREPVRELVERGWVAVCRGHAGSPLDKERGLAAVADPSAWKRPDQGGGVYWIRTTDEGEAALRTDAEGR